MKRPKYDTRISSAKRVLFIRAWDNCHPPAARVCEDHVAVRLLEPGPRLLAKTGVGRRLFLNMIYPWQRSIVGYVPLRTRLIDDRLKNALGDGLDQLVILGAGFDTRAYRFDALKNVSVFEVDRPKMQSEKKARLEAAFGSVPDHVTYIPVDFEKDDLAERLHAGGYDAHRKTFFIWEGVTFFLDPEAADRIPAFVVRNSGSGSAIMFDYAPPDVVDGTSDHPQVADMLDGARKLGEPYKFGIEPDSIAAFLSERGFTDVEDYSMPQLIKRYHTPAHERRSVMDFYHIVYAVVR